MVKERCIRMETHGRLVFLLMGSLTDLVKRGILMGQFVKQALLRMALQIAKIVFGGMLGG